MRGDERAQVVLSPIATPLPLAFVGLLIASTVLSGVELGWIPESQIHDAGWVLIAVPIPLQLVASLFGFRGRSATAATGSSTLAAAWLGIALSMITAPPGAPTPSNAVGMFALAISAALLIPALSDARGGSLLPAATLGIAAVRFLLTGITGLTHAAALRQATGIVGCVVAGVALYAALALELEGATEAPVIPTFRRTQSAASLVAPLDHQLDELEHEAGVRKGL